MNNNNKKKKQKHTKFCSTLSSPRQWECRIYETQSHARTIVVSAEYTNTLKQNQIDNKSWITVYTQNKQMNECMQTKQIKKTHNKQRHNIYFKLNNKQKHTKKCEVSCCVCIFRRCTKRNNKMEINVIILLDTQRQIIIYSWWTWR